MTDRLRELLDRWMRAHRDGVFLAPADLCAEAPECLPELEKWIEEFRSGTVTRPVAEPPPVGEETKSERLGYPPTLFPDTVAQPAGSAIEDYPSELGGFRLTHILGEGGMGRVYLADDPRLGRQVAVKVMKPEIARDPVYRERFLRESRSCAGVSHDHVIPVFAVGEEKGFHFLVMPLLNGESLDSRLRRGDAIPLREALRIAREVALGLEAAHAKGLVHRDIKPANVWLEGEARRAKILDFGLAKSVAQLDGDLTLDGAVLGTPSFMAPEQARGLPVDGRADLFSLGCILYRLVTGSRPFPGSDAIAVLAAVAADAPTPPHETPAGCPLALSELTMQLLEKRPERRPQSAREVADRLREIERELDEPLAPTVSGQVASPVNRRRTFRIVGLVIAMIVVITVVAVRLSRRDANESAPIVPIPSAPTRDPDREAAEAVLSLKGAVRVLGHPNDIFQLSELPGGPIRLSYVDLDEKPGATDAVLEKLKDCVSLEQIYLKLTPVTDAGLAHLANCRGLRVLDLFRTGIGDAGLAHLKDCTELRELHLYNTKIRGTGLPALKNLNKLEVLGLNATPITDATLALLPELPGLKKLSLTYTDIGDAGLACVPRCPALATLDLEGSRVTDAGLEQLKGMKKLNRIDLKRTRVSASGVAELRKALPGATVSWDGDRSK